MQKAFGRKLIFVLTQICFNEIFKRLVLFHILTKYEEEEGMNIAEVERLTGITKQNIRFYEKEGLIHPDRNQANRYREYGEEDIRRLNIIYVLRKMGVGISEIRKVLDGEVTLSEVMVNRQAQIIHEKEQQEALIEICKDMQMQSLEWLNTDKYKARIEEEEKKGNTFWSILGDYKDVCKSEAKKKFTIIPEHLVMNTQEFTDALLHFAQTEHADITITKESMYPEFIYNGVEYKAHRVVTRFGPIIHCEMVHPELAEPAGMQENRKMILQKTANYLPLVLVGAIWLLLLFGKDDVWLGYVIGILALLYIGAIFYRRR